MATMTRSAVSTFGALALGLLALLRPCAGLASPKLLKTVPKKVVAIGATGPLGRSLVGALAEAGSEVLVLSRQPFLASTKERVSHDYGWLSPKVMKMGKVSLRCWDGGDMLDIVGDDWLGWQNDVASFCGKEGAVVMNLVGGGGGAYTLGALERLNECIANYEAKVTGIVNVYPDDAVCKWPIARETYAKCEAASRGSGVAKVYNVRLGRVLGLDSDAIESNAYSNIFNLVSAPGQLSTSMGSELPWVFEDDAIRALAFVATDEIGVKSFVDAASININAEAPSSEFAAAGFGDWRKMK